MALCAVQFRVMPVSPSVDMKKLQNAIEKRLEEIGGILHKAEIQNVAFGLKSLIFTIGWKEENDPDLIETELTKVKDVQSIEITDVRRAIG
jgi:translation elongation factor aEF-1 beta